jgi:hypothetical protein
MDIVLGSCKARLFPAAPLPIIRTSNILVFSTCFKILCDLYDRMRII